MDRNNRFQIISNRSPYKYKNVTCNPSRTKVRFSIVISDKVDSTQKKI